MVVVVVVVGLVFPKANLINDGYLGKCQSKMDHRTLYSTATVSNMLTGILSNVQYCLETWPNVTSR